MRTKEKIDEMRKERDKRRAENGKGADLWKHVERNLAPDGKAQFVVGKLLLQHLHKGLANVVLKRM